MSGSLQEVLMAWHCSRVVSVAPVAKAAAG